MAINWRRGLWRTWIAATVLWVVGITLSTRIGFPVTEYWKHWDHEGFDAVLIERESAQLPSIKDMESVINDFCQYVDSHRVLQRCGERVFREECTGDNIPLLVALNCGNQSIYSVFLNDNKLSEAQIKKYDEIVGRYNSELYYGSRNHENFERIQRFALLALGVPVGVLATGAILLWIARGFRAA